MPYASPHRTECSVCRNHEQKQHANRDAKDDEKGSTFLVAVMDSSRHPVGDHSGSRKPTEDERDEGEGDPAARRELEFVPEPAPVSAHVLQEYLRRFDT